MSFSTETVYISDPQRCSLFHRLTPGLRSLDLSLCVVSRNTIFQCIKINEDNMNISSVGNYQSYIKYSLSFIDMFNLYGTGLKITVTRVLLV